MDQTEKSLSDEATFGGAASRRPAAEMSLGDERTLSDPLGEHETVIDDNEIIDLEARYRVEGTLGQGGMGAVLLATDIRLDRKVAIKRILGEAARSKTAIMRFLTEAKAIAALNHPNIVQIYDYGQAKDGPFLIMEYVDGGSLADRCREGAIPLEEAVELACQICDGLAKAHDAGIVHRDIKPANVLLNKDGLPKLTDFGLAKAEATDHGMTITGAVMGTPDFMPPEQRRDASEVDARSDLWSLAATVYQMVTGRSPKVIAVRHVPDSLQDVLTRALEDRKDDRYQTARELRDSLRTSIRMATVGVSTEAIEGRCPACGVHNDPSRKFCKGCAESLVAPCLACSDAIRIWDEICGSCGARQLSIVESRRAEMAAQQAEAEGLLGDCNFQGAVAVATQLQKESHPKLLDFRNWAVEFLAKVKKLRTKQSRQAADAMVEAGKHEAAHDYASAILSLNSIPEAMRQTVLRGMRESASQMIARMNHTLAAAERLEKRVRERIATKTLDDLLPDVEKLLSLRPDRKDVKKLRTQLVERQRRQIAARDKAVAAAKESLAAHDYENALRVLETIAPSTVTPDVENIRERAEKILRQTQNLSRRIKDAVAANRLDGLLPTVEQYLAVMPGDAEVAKLRESLRERQVKIQAEISSRLEEADKFGKACRFEEAQKSLASIPQFWRTAFVDACLDRMIHLQALRQNALDALSAAKAGAYEDAIRLGQQYEFASSAAEINDTAFAELLAKTRAAHAEEARAKEFLAIARLVGVVALAVFAVTAAGLWIRSNVRAWSLARAIEQQRWDDALVIDPDDTAALVGRARAKLSATPPDLSGAASDVDRAKRSRLSPTGRASVLVAEADIEAARAFELAAQGRLDDANRAFRNAQSANASPDWLAKAGTLIRQSWLKQGQAAVSKRDVKQVELAVLGARSAGMREDQITPLLAGRLMIEAVAALGKSENTKAVEIVRNALVTDPASASGFLKMPAYATVAEELLADCYERFRNAVDAAEWTKAVGIVAEAGAFATVANDWLPEALTAGRVGQLARDGRFGDIPASVYQELPQSTLADLPPERIASLPPLKNSVGMELRLLPAGSFTMGHPGFKGWNPHRVTLTKPFFIGVHEVTAAQWKNVMGALPPGKEADAKPMTGVSWDDAKAFCAALSALPAEKAAGRVYRLPTEAEWEYACRAGTTSDFGFGDDASRLEEFAWFDGNSGDAPHPVGMKRPNAWGLFDMHGNVQEWCADWHADYDSNAGATDPTGPATGSERVLRGGSYTFRGESVASHRRNSSEGTEKYSNVGLRCVVTRARKEKKIATSVVSTPVRPLTADSPVRNPSVEMVNSIGMDLKLLPAGTFTMGRAGGSNETPHQVTLTKSFYIGVYEVTNAEWAQVMGSVPSRWKEDDRPVTDVSWDDANEFCRRLSEMPEEKDAGRIYRLPTEAEWEYACRAGSTTEYSFGDDESLLGDFAWFDGNAGSQTNPVGQKRPNAWGLYDMHGNVWEWCSDWFGDYPNGSVTDPQGSSEASGRVGRGGGWRDAAGFCRSAFRYRLVPSNRRNSLGFRLALSPSGMEPPEAKK